MIRAAAPQSAPFVTFPVCFHYLLTDVELCFTTIEKAESRVIRELEHRAAQHGGLVFWYEQRGRVRALSATRIVRYYVQWGDPT